MSDSLEQSLFGEDSDNETQLNSNTQANNDNNSNNSDHIAADKLSASVESAAASNNSNPLAAPLSTEAALQSLFGESDDDEELPPPQVPSEPADQSTISSSAVVADQSLEVKPRNDEEAALQAELFGDEDESAAQKSAKKEDEADLEDEEIMREKQAMTRKKNEIIVARAEGEPLNLRVNNPQLPNNKSHLILFKVPNLLAIDSTPFDAATFESSTESSKDNLNSKAIDLSDATFQKKQEKTRASQMMLENVIRHRWVKDAAGNSVHESNARVIEWSNGSRQLWIGSEVFEIHERLYSEDKFTNFIYATNQGRLKSEENKSFSEAAEEETAENEEEFDEDEPSASLITRSLSNPTEHLLTAREKAQLRSRIRSSVGQVAAYYNFSVTGIESRSHLKLKSAVAELHTQAPKILRQFEAVDYDKLKVQQGEQARQEELKRIRRHKKEEAAKGSSAYRPVNRAWLEEEDYEAEAEYSNSNTAGGSNKKRGRYDDEYSSSKLNKAKQSYEMEDEDFLASDDDNANKHNEEDEEEAELHPSVKPRRSINAKPAAATEESSNNTSNNNNLSASSFPISSGADEEDFVLKKSEKSKRRKLLDEDSE
jgi:RNA polymerase-associated protein LEO1